MATNPSTTGAEAAPVQPNFADLMRSDQAGLQKAQAFVRDVQSHLGGAESERYLTFLQTVRELNAPWDGVPIDEQADAMRERRATVRTKLVELLKDSPDLAERVEGFLGGSSG